MYKRAKNKAFTLIELLVVILIISIVTSIAAVALYNFHKKRQLNNFTKELTMLMQLAQQQSILKPEIIGLKINKANYAFYQYQTKTGWQSIKKDNILYPRTIPANIELKIKTHGKYIIFLPNSYITPTQIIINDKNQITTSASGAINAKK